MSILDIDARQQHRKRALKTAFVYLLISLFCVLFGAVYEAFSHEVYSYYMIYSFVFPLAGGTLLFLVIALLGPAEYPGSTGRFLYHFGIAALTISSILRGVLEIYGTSNRLLKVFWIMGIVPAVIGLILIIVNLIRPARD